MKTNQNTVFEDRLSPKGPAVLDLSVAIADQLRDDPMVPSDLLVRQQEQHRVAIVGPGTVGATTAYALLMSGVAEEIVLVGRNRARAEGHAADLRHAEPFSRTTRIWGGNYADCAAAAVIVITAGVSQRSDKVSRLDDLAQSAQILRSIIPEIAAHNSSGILLIAANPVDVLTYAAWKWSGFPPNRVIGSGTLLDTSRFRTVLAQHYSVAPESIHAYIIGEHGDSQVPILSSANISGMRLEDFCDTQGLGYDPALLREMAGQARVAGQEILRKKGATSFGIGAALVRIIRTILRNEQTVLTVSGVAPASVSLGQVCLSLPSVIGRSGIGRVLVPRLDAGESEMLNSSAEILRSQIELLP
jgi:L-lactate dehydrogenase